MILVHGRSSRGTSGICVVAGGERARARARASVSVSMSVGVSAGQAR